MVKLGKNDLTGNPAGRGSVWGIELPIKMHLILLFPFSPRLYVEDDPKTGGVGKLPIHPDWSCDSNKTSIGTNGGVWQGALFSDPFYFPGPGVRGPGPEWPGRDSTRAPGRFRPFPAARAIVD